MSTCAPFSLALKLFRRSRFLTIRIGLIGLVFAIGGCAEPEDNALVESTSACHTSLAEKDLFASWANQSYSFALPQPQNDSPADLVPLINYLSDASLVGMGEATRGTSEFFRIKDQLFRGLVQQSGFKGIVFELPWGVAKVIDDYVTQGKSTAEDVLNQSFYWTYNTEEILEMIKWMRAYNLQRPPEEHIHFLGCDPQGPHFLVEQEIVYNYLRQVIPDSVDQKTAFFGDLPQNNLNEYLGVDLLIHQQNSRNIYELWLYMRANKANWIARTSAYAYQLAEFALEVIRQRENTYWFSYFGRERDETMALWTLRWQEILGADTKLAVWAHNDHVLDGWEKRWFHMGTFLRLQVGPRYKSVGFSFSRGDFNAFLANHEGSFRAPVRRQSIPQMTCGTANQLLEQVDGDRMYFIMEEQTGPSRDFFFTDQSFLQLGAGFNLAFRQNYTQPMPLGQVFDVLVHVDQTTASQLR